MRPITVTVGPLAAAVANCICTSQTPAAGQLDLNGTLVTTTFTGTGSISGNVLTISVATSGVLTIGQPVGGPSVAAGTVVTGVLTGTGGVGTYTVNVAQTTSSGAVYGTPVATLDTPRRVLFTAVGNESAKTFTITGTNGANNPIVDVVTGPNATTGYSNLDFKTVTSIVISAAAANAVTVGTNTVASSDWIRMDEYALPQVAGQCTATGTVNYTVQQTVQNPNNPTNPVAPYQLTWSNSTDTAAVGATGSIQTNYAYAPNYVRVTLNSGSGSVSSVFTQFGVVPY